MTKKNKFVSKHVSPRHKYYHKYYVAHRNHLKSKTIKRSHKLVEAYHELIRLRKKGLIKHDN